MLGNVICFILGIVVGAIILVLMIIIKKHAIKIKKSNNNWKHKYDKKIKREKFAKKMKDLEIK